jgi:hypothetical protein
MLSTISIFLVLSAPLVSMATGEGNMAPGILAPGSGKMALHEGNEVKKTRLINKSYPVTADDKLDIENQFGNVTVSTWDKAEITVDIEIGARGATDEKAQDIIDRIGVDDSKDDHLISFKTKVEEIHNSNGNRGREIEGERSFYIDYVIHMPSANRLEIENSFGKTEIPDFAGLVTLNSKFGSLNTGRLGNVDLVNVEFGRATIAAVTNGRVTFKYDKETRIGKVNGNVRITSDFSSNVQFNVADNVEDLSVFESYSAVRMVVGKDLSADIEAHTSFGSFHNDTEFTIKEHREDENDYGPHFDKDYSGTAGDGKGKIRIKSSFGSVRISNSNGRESDDDGDDDKDKGKDKHKSRTTTVSVSES